MEQEMKDKFSVGLGNINWIGYYESGEVSYIRIVFKNDRVYDYKSNRSIYEHIKGQGMPHISAKNLLINNKAVKFAEVKN